MEWVIGFYGIQLIALLVIGFVSWFIWDRRFKTKHNNDVPQGFIRTDEINIDPTTQKRHIVYYHPQTGERFYKEE